MSFSITTSVFIKFEDILPLKALVRFNKIIGKAMGKKDKGKG
jgi:hypothetical protein